MKRFLSLLTSLFLLISLSACAALGGASANMQDILEMPDDEMIVALSLRYLSVDFESLNEAQKVVCTAAALEMEVMNGGMVQFLSNEADGCAPYVCEALEKLGAQELLELLSRNLEENHVDLGDLSVFVTDDVEEFSALYDRYDFDAFDQAYGSICDLIRAYAAAHMDQLA